VKATAGQGNLIKNDSVGEGRRQRPEVKFDFHGEDITMNDRERFEAALVDLGVRMAAFFKVYEEHLKTEEQRLFRLLLKALDRRSCAGCQSFFNVRSERADGRRGRPVSKRAR
jgi:hypothetical protein